MLKKVFSYIISKGTGSEFELNPIVTSRDIIQFIFSMGFGIIRGIKYKLLLKKSSGFILVGRRVKVLNPQYIEVGKNFKIEDNVELQGLSEQGMVFGDNVSIGKYASIRPSDYYLRNVGKGLKVGNNSNIGPYNYIGCSGEILIGDNVMISPRVSIYAENHVFDEIGITMKSQGVSISKVIIEDDCWIAANSVILSGVTIGRGSVVAAGSVVTKNVEPYSIVGGIPAKLIKKRKS